MTESIEEIFNWFEENNFDFYHTETNNIMEYEAILSYKNNAISRYIIHPENSIKESIEYMYILAKEYKRHIKLNNLLNE